MVVEFAVLMPVAIVVALIVFNLVQFASSCSRFDRVALDAVTSQGVAPAGNQNTETAVGAVQGALEQGMGDLHVEVSVRAEGPSMGGKGSGHELDFPVSPLLTRFVCTMRYEPWPRVGSIAGVHGGSPVALTHERSLTVDRYRAGVIV